MAFTQTYDRLHVACLTKDQHRQTCGYWYTVTSNSTPHTAFRTPAALLRWLEDRGLSLASPLPEDCGVHASISIDGAYRTASHMSYDEFYRTGGFHTRLMDNARYTRAIISEDADGLRTVHHLNCNCRERPAYGHEESRQLEDMGAPPFAFYPEA
ncbi:hypothetical protein QUC32_23180 [Novosphingobium resinovorum]|uniref:hypothetical protein n=1 Tax=Novosphingobium TaxID=165696 RepID=UPI001B3C8B5A|nr:MULTISPECIES: hypothetical protein [Novosphingobium]MBF7012555.1 hypothetical protein [Novosphingobium sp. HR1a]WJM27288.1 hypothetical protein QUC32_23180 [Novosphingobium resinovorum]